MTFRKKWRLSVAGLCIVGFAVFQSIPISRRDDVGPDFDMQVVLGGNTRERSEVSHALWLRHPTLILVTGDGNYIRDALLNLGIPSSSIIHESTARSTWENARFSVPILKQRKVKSVVIVTSWFHTSRAYRCLTSLGQGIHFSTVSDPEPEIFLG